jgi:hypothetical protein
MIDKLPPEIWYIIIEKLSDDIDKFILKNSCPFFKNLVPNLEYIKFNFKLVFNMIRKDRLNQYLWILNEYDIDVQYTDYTECVNLYKDIYLNEKIKDFDTFVEFVFMGDYYRDFHSTV